MQTRFGLEAGTFDRTLPELANLEVEDARSALSSNVEKVCKAARYEQRHARTLALKQRVRRHCNDSDRVDDENERERPIRCRSRVVRRRRAHLWCPCESMK